MEDLNRPYAYVMGSLTLMAISLNAMVLAKSGGKKVPAASLVVQTICSCEIAVATNYVVEAILDISGGPLAQSDTRCRVQGAVTLWVMASATGNIMCLTILRYSAVVLQKKYPREFWVQYLIGNVVSAFIVGFLPFMAGISHVYVLRPNRTTCFINWASEENSVLWFLILCYIGMMLPAFLVAYSYPAIYLFVAQTTKQYCDNAGSSSSPQPDRMTVGEYTATDRASTPNRPSQQNEVEIPSEKGRDKMSQRKSHAIPVATAKMAPESLDGTSKTPTLNGSHRMQAGNVPKSAGDKQVSVVINDTSNSLSPSGTTANEGRKTVVDVGKREDEPSLPITSIRLNEAVTQQTAVSTRGESIEPPHTKREAEGSAEKNQKRLVLLQSGAIVAIFLASIVPQASLIAFELITKRNVSEEVDFGCTIAYLLNCVLSPVVIYAFGGIGRGSKSKD